MQSLSLEYSPCQGSHCPALSAVLCCWPGRGPNLQVGGLVSIRVLRSSDLHARITHRVVWPVVSHLCSVCGTRDTVTRLAYHAHELL
jgi:hypothetical protein